MSAAVSLADGLRVLELGPGLPGALAGMVLADCGAEVLKIEPPDGDPSRGEPAFRMWSRGKRRFRAELREPTDLARVQELARAADVVLTTWKPGLAHSLGLDYATLAGENPRLIVCDITAFGPRGPYAHYPAHEGVAAARAGRMLEFSCMCGGTRPAFSAVPIASYAASQLALHGVLAALCERESSGMGQHVETSLVQALTVYDLVSWLPGVPPALRLDDIPYLPYFVGRTLDGVWAQFAQLSGAQFAAFLRALDLLEVYQDPRFRNAPALTSPDDMRALRALLLQRFGERTWAEWSARFEKDPDLAVEPFRTSREALEHPQLRHNVLALRDDPELGPTLELAPLVELSATPARPGAFARETRLLAEAHWRTRPAAQSVPARGPARRRVLEGVTVLELATWVAAPFAATLLADLGARVIKIEPIGGEPFRQVMNGLPSTKTVMGKDSLAIDLKAPGAREIVHELVSRADILIHNYRPGVPELLGIDFPTLHDFNPRLVYVYGASYGSTGPYAMRPAYHPTAGAACGGALAQAGIAMPPAPDMPLEGADLARASRALELANETNPDPSAAVATATAALLGLYHRERSGVGQYIETSMFRSNAYANSGDFIDYEERAPRVRVDAELRGLAARYQLYPARDGWVFLGCPWAEEFAPLARTLDHPEWLEDPRFRDEAARRAHDGALADVIGEVIANRTVDELEAKLTASDLGCVRADRGPFATFMYQEPSMTENGNVVNVTSEQWREHRRFGPTVRLSRDSGVLRGSRRAGRESRAILAELGYSAAQIEGLLHQKVVGEPA